MKQFITLDEAIEKLNAGALGVLPTDTVYGVVCRAQDQKAVTRLYELKHREAKPGTVLAASIDQLVTLGIPRRYLVVVAQYWPNPISVVVPAPPSLAYLYQGKGSLAVRIPKDRRLLALLEQTGALLTSSANEPGEPTAETMQMAVDYFGGRVDFYVDGGSLSGHKPSTIIRVVDDAIEVLREGAVKINENGEVQNDI